MYLSFVIQNNNYYEILKMVELVKEVGVQCVVFNCVSIYEGMDFLWFNDEQNVEFEEWILFEVEKFVEQYDIVINIYLFKVCLLDVQCSKEIYLKIFCYIGWYFVIVLVDGMVNLCCECLCKFGLFKDYSFCDIWFSEVYCEFCGEIKDLFEKDDEVIGCCCYNCSFSLYNCLMYCFVNLFFCDGQGMGYGVKDLLKFMFCQMFGFWD